ncbi:MAG: UDP-N-acetylglucosamine 1-carboxyvinyltransferase [Acidobacteriota bacterium]
MDRLRIKGQRRLEGRLRVGGAKNAALPAMAACLLTDQPVALENVPEVRDIGTMGRLLSHLQVKVEHPGTRSWRLEALDVPEPEAPYDLVKRMRASVLCLGPLVARFGRARVSLPGGCAIGARPIDMHIAGLRRLGVEIRLEHGYVEARCAHLRGAQFQFPGVSVTGTENLMMAATLARGETVLRNCAAEPEVSDLADLLRRMGAHIEGDGSDVIHIQGVEQLGGAEHSILPDRIVAGTFLMAGAITGGRVGVEGCRPADLNSTTDLLERCGCRIERAENSLLLEAQEPLQAHDVRTAPHPGFPTDLQAQYMALMTQARGSAIITETIFENRFMHVAELQRMGADIRVTGRHAVVRGPTPLEGTKLMATDLRASASLVLAGLAASGETWVDRVYHIDRGYESIEGTLAGLGAAIERLPGPPYPSA